MRWCYMVYDGEVVGTDMFHRNAPTMLEIKTKVVGTDVFRLVVQPGVGVSLAMAMVVASEQMFTRPSISPQELVLAD